MLMDALKLMGTGIGVVFMVLAVFFTVIKILMKAFPSDKEEKEQK
jgi:Na+-transporting methylmalonyl-CoA/oxaloacetate decarboxylase gamma subunit